MKKIIISFLLLVSTVGSIAVATEQANEQAATQASAPVLQSEEQIPLKLAAIEKNDPSNSTSHKLILTLGLIVIMVGAGYYGIKRFSFTNKNVKSNMQIKILSQHFLGPKKSLAIIRVAGESILVGITDQNINIIKSLALLDDELPQILPKNFDETIDGKNFSEMDADDFSLENLSTTVSQKIKSMRNIQ